MDEFLNRSGWSILEPVGEDGAARRYNRVQKNNQTAILMSVYGDTPGHRIDDFIRIGAWLNDIGLNAPDIYEVDEARGLVLLEDFGHISFKAAMAQGENPEEVYTLATEILAHLGQQDCPLTLPNYYDSHVHTARRRVIDWYVPALRGAKNPDSLAETYLKVWDDIEKSLPPCPQSFLHVDFHVENLMYLPDRDGMQRCGILDFQGGMIGPAPYDLGNLLEDMRMDVPEGIRQALLANKGQDYLNWYRVLTTQFHCRLIGQIIRWAVKDNKPAYLQYLPRIASYLQSGLDDPLLAPLKQFFSEEKIDFSNVNDLNKHNIGKHIRSDAV